MTLFNLALQPGSPIVEQVVFAAVKAILLGEYQPGHPFPSVRALAADLKIHPNTAHKVVQHLIQERWLEVRSGVGTVVAVAPRARSGDRQRLLRRQVEQLVVEAWRVGVDMDDLNRAIATEWAKLDESQKEAAP